MADILAVVQFEHVSGLPKDRYANTFWFDGALTSGNADIIAAQLEDFYNNTNGGAGDLGNYMSDVIVRGSAVHRIKIYDATVPPIGSPFADYQFELDSSGVGNNLPSEVAVCLSFRANPTPGGIQARRRGRIYFGPLTDNAIEYDGQVARPDSTMVGFLLASANRLHDVTQASTEWVVHSRVADSNAVIQVAWVDNAFDTQRRRGEAASGRTTMNL